jgi:hypothetical protein
MLLSWLLLLLLLLQATGKQIVFVSRCVVIAFGLLSGVLAIVLMKIGLSLGWVYLVSHGDYVISSKHYEVHSIK